MGSSRDWGAEKEDEVVTCRHGEESLYFNTCTCSGCRLDSENRDKQESLTNQIKSRVLERVKGMGPDTSIKFLQKILEEL